MSGIRKKAMECSDLIGVAVRAILQLGAQSTVTAILAIMQVLCQPQGITLAQAQAALDEAVRRGVCCLVTGPPDLYGVRNDMVTLRPDNTKYWAIVNSYITSINPGNDPAPPAATSNVFFDDFNNGFDFSKWYVIKKQFGANNNGIVPLNVQIRKDQLQLLGNGDLYTGPIQGVEKVGPNYPYVAATTRVGGGIISKQYFASGRYEVRARILPYYGAYSAFWTFYYAEDGLDITNHEIDIETAGRPDHLEPPSFDYFLGNTFQTEVDVQTNFINQRQFTGFPLNDGEFHTYRFDWFSGGGPIAPRVDFYIDDVKVGTNTQNVPFIAGRFWIAIWFPDVVAGTPTFVTGDMLIDWVRITPIPNRNDVYLPESYPDDGIAPMSELNHLR